MTTAEDMLEQLKELIDKWIDRAIRWLIAITGIAFFVLIYLLLSLPMMLCRGCENLFGHSEKQSGIN